MLANRSLTALVLAVAAFASSRPAEVGASASGRADQHGVPMQNIARYCAANGATGAVACTAILTSEAERAEAIAEANAAADVGEGARTSVLVGQLFADINAGGSVFNIYGTSSCSGGVLRAAVGNLGTFNDLTSSLYSTAGCKMQIWDNSNYTGVTLGPLSSSDYVGATINDKTSSVKVA